MKQKELKELAERIGELELALTRETNENVRKNLEREIMFLSENEELGFCDYFILDELILEYVEKRKRK